MGLVLGEGTDVERAPNGNAPAQGTRAGSDLAYPARVSPVTPWIQVVRFEWRPELEFFEKRRPLLQELEGSGLLRQFSWGADQVIVRVDEHAAVRVAANGATAWLTSPKVGLDRCRAVLTAVWAALKPQNVIVAPSRLRYLAPIANDPREAQRQSAGRVVGRRWVEAHPTDWALLVDGLSERVHSTFQVEFGVVRPEEVAVRYSSPGSRVGPLEMVVPPDLKDLPKSAVFLDWDWQGHFAVEGNSMEGVFARWDALLAESERLSIEMCDQSIPGYTPGIEEKA